MYQYLFCNTKETIKSLSVICLLTRSLINSNGINYSFVTSCFLQQFNDGTTNIRTHNSSYLNKMIIKQTTYTCIVPD